MNQNKFPIGKSKIPEMERDGWRRAIINLMDKYYVFIGNSYIPSPHGRKEEAKGILTE